MSHVSRVQLIEPKKKRQRISLLSLPELHDTLFRKVVFLVAARNILFWLKYKWSELTWAKTDTTNFS